MLCKSVALLVLRQDRLQPLTKRRSVSRLQDSQQRFRQDQVLSGFSALQLQQKDTALAIQEAIARTEERMQETMQRSIEQSIALVMEQNAALATDLITRPVVRQRLHDQASKSLREEMLTAADRTAVPVHEKPSPIRDEQCTCGASTHVSSWSQNLFLCVVGHTLTSRHSPLCPLHLLSKRKERYRVQLRPLPWQIMATRVTVEIIRSAGSGVLSRNLTCARIVSKGGPAFALITSIWKNSYAWDSDLNLADALQHARRDLRHLFVSGNASPADVLPSGRNLLHIGS